MEKTQFTKLQGVESFDSTLHSFQISKDSYIDILYVKVSFNGVFEKYLIQIDSMGNYIMNANGIYGSGKIKGSLKLNFGSYLFSCQGSLSNSCIEKMFIRYNNEINILESIDGRMKESLEENFTFFKFESEILDLLLMKRSSRKSRKGR